MESQATAGRHNSLDNFWLGPLALAVRNAPAVAPSPKADTGQSSPVPRELQVAADRRLAHLKPLAQSGRGAAAAPQQLPEHQPLDLRARPRPGSVRRGVHGASSAETA